MNKKLKWLMYKYVNIKDLEIGQTKIISVQKYARN